MPAESTIVCGVPQHIKQSKEILWQVIMKQETPTPFIPYPAMTYMILNTIPLHT